MVFFPTLFWSCKPTHCFILKYVTVLNNTRTYSISPVVATLWSWDPEFFHQNQQPSTLGIPKEHHRLRVEATSASGIHESGEQANVPHQRGEQRGHGGAHAVRVKLPRSSARTQLRTTRPVYFSCWPIASFFSQLSFFPALYFCNNFLQLF